MSRRRKLSKRASKKMFYAGANKTNVKNLSNHLIKRGSGNL